VIHTPDVPPRSKRKQSKRAKASGSVDDSRMEVMVEQILIKLTNHIDTSLSKHMDKVADVSAQVTWTIFCMLLSAKMHLYTA
jgi:predicted aldo/keto reductase-like oxidoreductase